MNNAKVQMNDHKKNMNLVFEEIKNIKIIESNVYRNKYDFGNFGNAENLGLSGKDYIYTGVKNELSSSLLYKEDNKWYGFYNENISIIKAEDYFKNNSVLFMCLPIVDSVRNTKGELFLFIQHPEENLKPRTREYTMLPKQKHFHFINIKNKTCSCRAYFYCNECDHI